MTAERKVQEIQIVSGRRFGKTDLYASVMAKHPGSTPGTPINENHRQSCHRAHPGIGHGEWEHRRRNQ